MKEIIKQIAYNNELDIFNEYKKEELLFFDIETTGFSPASTTLYLIGCAYFENDAFTIKQWFADDISSEKEILMAFLSLIHNYKALVHYNGNGFDIPYIIKKCDFYGLKCDFKGIESIDIYKLIQPVKSVFKLENIKQKSIEKFLGVDRIDRYSGGELIKIYTEYLKHPLDDMENTLLLHNHDDILGLLKILPIISYSKVLKGSFRFSRISISDTAKDRCEVNIELNTDYFLPVRISYGNKLFYMSACNNTIKLCIQVYTGELKFFYQNYKDYYYLPMEDRSIHKSVAFYVDKNFRTKAKAANCYSKKTGLFLPQYEEIISPYFKIDYYDKISYFEYADEFINNPDLILTYSNHIIQSLIKL